jgi:hypothetical protein
MARNRRRKTRRHAFARRRVTSPGASPPPLSPEHATPARFHPIPKKYDNREDIEMRTGLELTDEDNVEL